MRTWLQRFNIYLLLALVAVAASSGCKTFGKKKEASTLRLHLEVNEDASGASSPVPVYRASPVYVNVEKQPFLNEATISKASVVDVMGGFAIFVQYDRKGSWLLEQYTTANKGKRMAIFSQFGEVRWLAAPVITKRITDGALVFTPDATREEAERIVRGLNNVAKEMKD